MNQQLFVAYPEAASEVDMRTGETPVHQHADRDCSDSFLQVLCSGNPLHAQVTSNNGELPLHIACGSANLAAVEYLYELYPACIHVMIPQARERPLHILLKRGNTEISAMSKILANFQCDTSQKT